MLISKCKFSVIVCTYNTPMEKIKLTIKSVVEQEFDDLELVISDDGSTEFDRNEIEKYLQKHQFYNYTIIEHNKNIGTVRNFAYAVEKAKGKYIKGLGGGDFLYDKNSIKDMFDFLEKTQCELCFGRARKFRKGNGKIKLLGAFNAPRHIKIYESKFSNILSDINILICHDWVSGAEMFGNRQTFLFFVQKLIPKVKYIEDIFQILAIAEGKRFKFFDKYILYYEWGEGISTKRKNNSFTKIMKNDLEEAISIADKEYSNKILYKLLLNIGKNRDSTIVKMTKKYFNKKYV